MSRTLTLLSEIEPLVAANSLNASISDDELSKILSGFNLSNPEILDLYSWKNGSIFNYQPGDIAFCSHGYLLPLQTALNIYNDPDHPEFKRDGLLPILSDYDGDYISISINEPNLPAHICSAELFIPEPEPFIENLATFLLCIRDCYRQNAYIFLPEN